MNTEAAAMYLYIIMGAILGIVIIAGVVLAIVNRRRKKKKVLSVTTDGSDSSDFADTFTERLRNERFNHRQ